MALLHFPNDVPKKQASRSPVVFPGPLVHQLLSSRSCGCWPLSQESFWVETAHSAFVGLGLGLAPLSRSAPAGPATRHLPPAHVDPPLPLLAPRRLWQTLGPEASLLSDYAAAGGLRSQSERFIVVFRGRLGADVIMSVNALCKL